MGCNELLIMIFQREYAKELTVRLQWHDQHWAYARCVVMRLTVAAKQEHAAGTQSRRATALL
jgi:hypothetical protein